MRQQPLTEIESPCAASEVTTGPRMVRRTASPSCSSAVTVPFSSTIPVNISRSPRVCRIGVPMMRMSGPILRRSSISMRPQVGQRGGLPFEGGPARAEHGRGDVADHAVDEARRSRRRRPDAGRLRATRAGCRARPWRSSTASGSRVGSDQGRGDAVEDPVVVRDRRLADDDPQRLLLVRQGQVVLAAHGQARVVGEHRAGAGHDRVGLGPEDVDVARGPLRW